MQLRITPPSPGSAGCYALLTESIHSRTAESGTQAHAHVMQCSKGLGCMLPSKRQRLRNETCKIVRLRHCPPPPPPSALTLVPDSARAHACAHATGPAAATSHAPAVLPRMTCPCPCSCSKKKRPGANIYIPNTDLMKSPGRCAPAAQCVCPFLDTLPTRPSSLFPRSRPTQRAGARIPPTEGTHRSPRL